MPANCNSQINLKNIRIEDPIDENLAVYMYYDKMNDALRISHINPDVTAVPNFSKFDFTDSIKEYFYTDLTTTLKVEFDGQIGSSTTITSQNGTISPILPSAFGENYIVFTYYNSSLTDNITLKTYNSTNGKFKTTVHPIILKTTNTIPNNIASNVNTQDYQYNNVSVSFNKSVKSIGSISSLNAPSQTITYSISGGLVTINYKTPAGPSDTLTFNGIVDTSDFPNPDPVQLVLTNRFLPGPAFSGLVAPALNTISQNWTYTNIEANFSKNIIQNPVNLINITASTGNAPTNLRVINGNILFDWTTSNVSSAVLTFNNLYASDFTFDSGTLETLSYSLRSQPISPSWVVQPVLKNTTYTNIEVSFNKRISSCDVVSDGTITNKFINVRGNLQFDIITGPTNTTYTFNNIIAEDFGRNTGLTLTTGPAVSSYTSATNILNDNKVLIQGPTPQLFTVTFNKSITNNPTITLNSGTGVYSSGTGATRIYSLSNITSSTNLMTFGNIQGSDSSSSTGLTIVLDPKTALTFDYIADVQFPDVARGVNYDVGTLYDLYFKLKDQTLNADFSGVGISINGGGANIGAISQVHNSSSYKFTLTPTIATTTGNEKQLSLTNARDINSFIYPSISSLANLVFKAVLPSFLLNYISFKIPQGWNEANTTAWGLDGKNADGSWTSLSVSSPANLGIGSFSQTNSNTKPYTTYRMFTSFATAGGGTMRIKALRMRNNNVLIPSESLSSSTASTTGYYLQYAEYSDPAGTLNRRYIQVADAVPKFNDDNGLANPHELWGSNVNTGRCMTLEITKLS